VDLIVEEAVVSGDVFRERLGPDEKSGSLDKLFTIMTRTALIIFNIPGHIGKVGQP